MSEKGFSNGEKAAAVAGIVIGAAGVGTAAGQSANVSQEVASAQAIISEVANPNSPLGEQLTPAENKLAERTLEKNPVDPSDISVLRNHLRSVSVDNGAKAAVEEANQDLEQVQTDKNIQTVGELGAYGGAALAAGGLGIGGARIYKQRIEEAEAKKRKSAAN